MELVLTQNNGTTTMTSLQLVDFINHLRKQEGNGTYKVLTITYRGDSSGTDWSQEVICVSLNETKLLLAENEKANKDAKK